MDLFIVDFSISLLDIISICLLSFIVNLIVFILILPFAYLAVANRSSAYLFIIMRYRLPGSAGRFGCISDIGISDILFFII